MGKVVVPHVSDFNPEAKQSLLGMHTLVLLRLTA